MDTPDHPNKNPAFLHVKYGGKDNSLNTSPEVARAARFNEVLTGEELSLSDPNARIQNFLDYVTRIMKKESGKEVLKHILYDEYIIKPDNPVFSVSSPERLQEITKARRNEHGQPIDEEGDPYKLSLFDRQILRFYEEGRGLGTVPPEEQQQEIARVIKDQKQSLDAWVDYLASDDSKAPDWLKYFALRSVLTMGTYDKERQVFRTRSADSISPFPHLNHGALAVVLDAIEDKYKSAQDIPDTEFATENFSKLYAAEIAKLKPQSESRLARTDGAWRTYTGIKDAAQLQADITALPDHDTGWCLRGLATAQRYLTNNTLQVYYSFDEHADPTSGDKPTVPRIVIVSHTESGSKKQVISEVRGVAEQENLDGPMSASGIVEEKLQSKEFVNGASFEKKDLDMKKLTFLVWKQSLPPESLLNKTVLRRLKEESERLFGEQDTGLDFTGPQLKFLYEIDSSIDGFGYQRDTRIQQLLSHKNRDIEKDMLIIFDNQIARTPDQIINGQTIAYIGKLVDDEGKPSSTTIQKIQSLEYVYTSFPEGRKKIWHGLSLPKLSPQ